MASIEAKRAEVDRIKENFASAKSAIVVDYRGLSAGEATELRAKFREGGVVYKVFKNSLVRIAINGTEFESLTEALSGPNAIAFGVNDAVVPAKIIKEFAKTHPKLELRCGVVEGTFYDNTKIIEIADLPSKDALIGRFLGSIKAPVSNFAYLLANIIKEKEKEEVTA